MSGLGVGCIPESLLALGASFCLHFRCLGGCECVRVRACMVRPWSEVCWDLVPLGHCYCGWGFPSVPLPTGCLSGAEVAGLSSAGVGCLLHLTLWYSWPWVMGPPSGAALFPLLGWMHDCHWDVEERRSLHNQNAEKEKRIVLMEAGSCSLTHTGLMMHWIVKGPRKQCVSFLEIHFKGTVAEDSHTFCPTVYRGVGDLLQSAVQQACVVVWSIATLVWRQILLLRCSWSWKQD